MLKRGKKFLATVLSLVLFANTCLPTLAAVRPEASVTDYTVTDAELVASFYGSGAYNPSQALDAAEQALITDAALMNAVTYSITRPTTELGLVTIDQENKTITALHYSNGSLVWEPTVAYLTDETVTDQEIELIGIGDEGVSRATFETTSDNYSFKVDYQVRLPMERNVALRFMNTPVILRTDVNNMTTVIDAKEMFRAIQDSADQIINYATVGVSVFGHNVQLFTDSTGNPIQAINALQADMADGSLNLFALAEAYTGASTATKLNAMMNEGVRVDIEVINLYGIISALLGHESFTTIETFHSTGLLDDDTYNNAMSAKAGLQLVADTLAPMVYEWEIYYTDLGLVPGVDMNALGARVDALTNTVKRMDAISSLLVDYVTVEAAVNRTNVIVEVYGKKASGVTGDTTLVDLPVYTSEAIKVNKGTSKADYLTVANLTAVMDAAIASWGVDSASFVYPATNNEAELPEEAGDENIVVKITLDTKMLDVTEVWTGEEPLSVPYGYVYGFAAHSDPEKAYLYTVNGGDAVEQNGTFVVKENVSISRNTDRAKKSVTVNSIVAKAMDEAKAQAILNAAALNPESIRVKYPNNNDELAMARVSGTGTVVTAATYDSGYNGLKWVPYTADIDGTIVTFTETEGVYTAEAGFMGQNITVNYRLTVDVANALALANLPHTLATEAAQQKAELDELLGYKSTIDSNTTYINLVKFVIKAEYGFTDEVIAAYQNLSREGLYTENETTNMRLSQYLGYYAENGLTYYYTGGDEAIQYQVNLLKNFCVLLNDDGQNEEALKLSLRDFASQLPDGMTIDDVVAKFDDIITFLSAYNPLPVNAAIDTDHDDLAVLVAALTASGTTREYTTAPATYLETPIVSGMSGKVTVTLVVEYPAEEIQPFTTQIDATIPVTQDVMDELEAELERMMGLVDGLHYVVDEQTIEGSELVVGELPGGNVTYIVSYVPVSYTVVADGEVIDQFTYNGQNRVVTLPAPTNPSLQYEYDLDTITNYVVRMGQEVKVTLTPAMVDQFAVDGVVTFNKRVQDVSVIEYTSFANKLTTAIGDKATLLDAEGNVKIAFMPMLNPNMRTLDPSKALVMRTTYTKLADLDTAALMEALGLAFVDYGYIAIGGETLWDGTALSVQTLTNAFINAGFGMDSMKAMIEANGDLKEMTLDGHINLFSSTALFGSNNATVRQPELLGAKVIETTLSYGADAATATTVKFFITLEDFDENRNDLKEMEDSIDSLAQYANINSVDGKLDVVVNMPASVYELYLTYMLLEQEVTLDTFNDVELETLLTYAKDTSTGILSDLAAGEAADANRFFTTLVVENTLGKLGQNFSLTPYGATAKTAVKLLDKLMNSIERNNVVYAGNTVSTDLRYPDLKAALNAINPLAGTFVSDTELNIPAKFTVTNVGTEYDAYVIELPESTAISANTVKEMMTLTTDLATELNSLGKNAYVVLLKDVTLSSDATINSNNVVIDLNGYNLTGNMNATGERALIVDNTLTTKATGVVTGNLTGNFKVFAGSYTADVTAMLPAGYVVEDGYVRHEAYLLEEAGTEVKVILESAIFDTTEATATNAVVNAVFNLVNNFVGYHSADVNGKMLYTLGENSIFDIVDLADAGRDAIIGELVTYVGPKAVEDITNGVLAAVADLETLAAGTGPLYTTGLTLYPFDLFYGVAGGTSNDAYLDVAYGKDTANAVNKTLSFYLGDDNLKDKAAELAEILVINKAEITLGDQIGYNGNYDFTLDHSGEFDVALDLSGDTNYSIVIATILGHNAADKAPWTAAVDQLTSTGSIAGIKALVDRTTVAQLISALKAANGKSFAAMVNAMGYADTARANEVKALEAKYSMVLDVLYKVVAKSGITGGSTKLGAWADANDYGAYTTEQAAYGVTAKVSLKLFSNKPVIVKATPSLQGVEDKFYGFKLDETTRTLFVDTDINGITLADLAQMFDFSTYYADTTSLTADAEAFNRNNLGEDVLVNGAQFTIKAVNAFGEDTRTYTLVILGDTNSDGMINSGDATRIFKTWMHEFGGGAALSRPMTELEIYAGNTNADDVLSSGDCVKIMVKWLFETADQGTYTTSLRNEVIR